MPTGVALTMPADLPAAVSSDRSAARSDRAEAHDEVGARAPVARACVLCRRSTHRRGAQVHQREGDRAALPRRRRRSTTVLPSHRVARPRSPRSCGGSRCGRCCGRRCGRSCRSSRVLTAPICCASAETSSSSGITASLQGKVTLTPAKPAVRAAASRSLEPAARQAVESPSGGSGPRMPAAAKASSCSAGDSEFMDVGADQADQACCARSSRAPPSLAAVRRRGTAGRCADRPGCSAPCPRCASGPAPAPGRSRRSAAPAWRSARSAGW